MDLLSVQKCNLNYSEILFTNDHLKEVELFNKLGFHLSEPVLHSHSNVLGMLGHLYLIRLQALPRSSVIEARYPTSDIDAEPNLKFPIDDFRRLIGNGSETYYGRSLYLIMLGQTLILDQLELKFFQSLRQIPTIVAGAQSNPDPLNFIDTLNSMADNLTRLIEADDTAQRAFAQLVQAFFLPSEKNVDLTPQDRLIFLCALIENAQIAPLEENNPKGVSVTLPVTLALINNPLSESSVQCPLFDDVNHIVSINDTDPTPSIKSFRSFPLRRRADALARAFGEVAQKAQRAAEAAAQAAKPAGGGSGK